jgi:MoaE-MoaD fusion protein
VTIKVRLFAMQRELAGTREAAIDLPAGATIEDAWQAVVDRFPALGPGRVSLRFARNGAYARPDTALADGDELAMIPPVSGGSAARPDPAAPSPSPEGRVVELRSEPFGQGILEDLAARISTPDDGAVVAFLGVTRRSPGTPAPGQAADAARHAGRTVEGLEYEAHASMAVSVMTEIADEIAERFGVTRIAIVHREGAVPLGDASVAIVACAPHRDAAFAAARYAIDETKARAPIWKAEHFTDGHIWIGEPAREGPR